MGVPSPRSVNKELRSAFPLASVPAQGQPHARCGAPGHLTSAPRPWYAFCLSLDPCGLQQVESRSGCSGCWRATCRLPLDTAALPTMPPQCESCWLSSHSKLTQARSKAPNLRGCSSLLRLPHFAFCFLQCVSTCRGEAGGRRPDHGLCCSWVLCAIMCLPSLYLCAHPVCMRGPASGACLRPGRWVCGVEQLVGNMLAVGTRGPEKAQAVLPVT